MLTQEYLKSRLRYDPGTGHFYWVAATKRFIGKVAGYVSKRGYMVVTLDGQKYYMHRLAWLYIHGCMPKLMDHRNRVRIDNRLSNLRCCTDSENGANRTSNNKTTLLPTGVYRNRKRYCAQIMKDKKTICLGTYDTPEEASEAYQKKRLELFGEFA